MNNSDVNKAAQYFESIFKVAHEGIIFIDYEGIILRINPAFTEMLGYEEHELQGKPFYTLAYESQQMIDLMSKNSLHRFYSSKEASMEIILLGKKGNNVPVRFRSVLIRDEYGQVTQAIGVIEQIATLTGNAGSESSLAEKMWEAQQDFANILNNSSDIILLCDISGNIMMANTTFLQLVDYKQEEVYTKHVVEFCAFVEGTYATTTGEEIVIDGEYVKNAAQMSSELFEKGYVQNWQMYFVRKDKVHIPVETTMSVLKDKNGDRRGSVIIARNITERKNAEKEIREAKEYLDNAIENSLDAIIITDNNGYLTKANRSFVKLIGCKEEEVIGKHIGEFTILEEGTYESTTGEAVKIGSKYFDDITTFLEKLVEEGGLPNHESYKIRSDKKVVPIESNTALLYNDNKEQVGAIGIIRDITERKKSEKELKETKDFLEKIIENSKDGILVVDNMGNILSCNTAIEHMSGFGKEKIIGNHAATLIIDDKETRQRILEKTAELFEKGFATYDAKYKSKDGKYLDVECTSSMISNEKGEYIAGVSIIRDISERKKAEYEIREGKEFLEKIIKGSKDGILIGDGEGYILSANEAMEEMLGLSKEEIVGKHSSELLLDDRAEREKVLEQMGELFESGYATYEARYKSKNSDYVEVECHLSMIKDENESYIAGITIVRDITERKKMQQKLLQSEKLRSLGELAGGVAHDFNNVLAAILGRAQLLKMQFKPPSGKQEKRKSILNLFKSLEIIERAASDGAETVRRIQEFSRKRSDDKDFTQVNINELLENVLEFTGVRWKDDAESKGIKINIQKEFSSLASTLGSASELREVFTNIINNALDAMPQGGCITIKTSTENNQIAISIKDTGVGIPEDIRNRIFDPFFTTKGVQSTGLGMSTSYGIINRHQGTIVVDSVEGKGTTFTIKLPIIEGSLGEKETMVTMPRKQRKARILVVDDEDEVRQLLSDILTSEEHDVASASDGAQAVELFNKNDFDMVFTDLGMPGMSGWEVAKAIKGINRKVPVTIITGWNVDMEAAEMKESGADLIAYKPFEVKRILQLVQEGMELRNRFEAA